MDIIRKTKSNCPVCLNVIDAFILEKDGAVFFIKTCVQHGKCEILLSKSPLYYRKLDEFYFGVMNEIKKLREYEIWPTLRCNMDCRICALQESIDQRAAIDPSCEEIENFIKDQNVPFYIISGGEPTCREDLDAIIRILKKRHKTTTINTNGLKLADVDYLKKLRKSGLDRVNLQFDGFDRKSYKIFRGEDLLDIKLKVLENLKNLHIPTILNATIAKKVNEGAVIELIDFAAKNDFINGINFFTICYTGGARDWPLDNYIMPDEIIEILEQGTIHRVTRRNVFLFQKLHLAVKSLLSQRFCFYNQIYVLVRELGSYEPIDKFINLAQMELWLDKYQSLYIKNRVLAKMFLIIALFLGFLSGYFSFVIIKELLIAAGSYFFKTPHYLKTKRFFYLSLSTGCDPYKIDYDIVQNCQNEIIGPDSISGKLGYLGRDGLYCINLEKLFFSKKANDCLTAK